MSRILLLFASSHGQTRAIAEAIANRLRDASVDVELRDLELGTPPTPTGFDAVVVGSRIHFGKHAAALTGYLERHREALARIPTYLFSVSGAAIGHPELVDPNGYMAKLTQATELKPARAVAIAGAVPYRKYNPILRLAMKLINASAGHPTDTSRNHDLTDWAQVALFADQISHDLAQPLRGVATRVQTLRG
jgi:menaquinone-dependent protoporphyrinogen oxidase